MWNKYKLAEIKIYKMENKLYSAKKMIKNSQEDLINANEQNLKLITIINNYKYEQGYFKTEIIKLNQTINELMKVLEIEKAKNTSTHQFIKCLEIFKINWKTLSQIELKFIENLFEKNKNNPSWLWQFIQEQIKNEIEYHLIITNR